MQRLGVVDLGSNTARLVVYEFEPGRWFRLADEVREPVRLGEGFAASGRLGEAALARGDAALRLYADYAEATGLGALEVIATSAVREAANRGAFLNRARDLGLSVEVLSGEGEARLGVLAVANSFACPSAWVVDLGGGSAQLSRLEGRAYRGGTAYPLGAVRLTEAHLRSDPPKGGEVAALERTVERELGPALEAVRDSKDDIVAMGGTVRNLARAVQRAGGYPLDLTHGYRLEREALEGLVADLLRKGRRERAAVGGIHPDRADVILAGALVYRTILRRSGRDGLLVSGQGVREGALYRRFLPPPHLIEDVRAFSVANLFQRYPQPREHTERVRVLARRLFELLSPLHGYGAPEARLLDEAATLHDIGMAINYHDHHKHGAYLVLGGALPGMSHREQALLALLVQYHRKGEPKLGNLRPLLERDDASRLERLSACLRLAEHLERSRAGRVRDLSIELGNPRLGDPVRLRLHATEPPWVELWEAAKQADLFRAAFGRDLALERA